MPNARAVAKAAPVISLMLLGMTGGWVMPVHAAVYKYTDARGIIHYTDRKPAGGQRYQVLIPDSPGVDWSTVPLNLTAYAQEIRRACERYRVDTALVRAVIHAESWFKPYAISNKGAQGLMQLMPATMQRYGVQNAFDISENIGAGVHYLNELLETFGGDVELATAAYNAGPNAVKEHGGIPPYPETRTYVERVEILHRRYLQAM